MAAEWQGRVRDRLGRWRAAGLGADWVVAVSGGGDSVGLLRVLEALGAGLGLRLSVAHLDHGVRGESAREDARFVARLAGELGLPLDLGSWRPTRAGHFEADARRARYAWLAEVARARNAAVVAVGHTRDDQAETILHRIVRGTGPGGLAGMPARRTLAEGGGDVAPTLVRPLLTVARQDVRDFLAGLGQPFRDDASNADLSRTRARIRHDLLPKLAAEYNPRVGEALVRLGELADASRRAARGRLERLARAVTLEAGPDALVLRGDKLARRPPAERAEVIRLAWRRAGWPEGAMDAARRRRLAALVRSDGGRLSVGAGIDAWRAGDLLRLAPAQPHGDPTPSTGESALSLPLPGSADWGAGRVVATLDPDEPRDETIDLDRLDPPLGVRAPGPGDRVEPLGMGGRTTSLNDFFRGRGVPRAGRPGVPLVVDRAGIVWVVGHRIADRVRVTEATRRTLGLRWDRDPGPRGCD